VGRTTVHQSDQHVPGVGRSAPSGVAGQDLSGPAIGVGWSRRLLGSPAHLATVLHGHGRTVVPGLVLAAFVAVAATQLGSAVPVVGAPVFGILLGLVLAAVVKPGHDLRPGLAIASKQVLQASIVVLGLTLSLHQVARVGLASLPVMLGTLATALLGAWLLGRLLGVRGDTQVLIGVGTAICGASAIAATTAVLRPKQASVAYAIGTIFTFNIAAVLLFPALGHAWHLSPQSFGLWSGTAVNDTSSVVASSVSFSPAATPYAVVVKLSRTLTLIPIVLALAIWRARRHAAPTADAEAPVTADAAPISDTEGPVSARRRRASAWRKIVPLFLIGFVVASALDTLGLIPTAWDPALTGTSTFLITTALAGIGLSMRRSDIRGAGHRPLVLGGLLWALVGASSLGLQALTHTF
jgi:uncharacterized integral membrane protein (TIGR00698 family)